MNTTLTSKLDELLGEITPVEQAKSNARMQIAARIADGMNAKGWKNKDLLKNIGKIHPSVISKWLSGTHNFTIDTLVELEQVLDISLLNVNRGPNEIVTRFYTFAIQTTEPFDLLGNTSVFFNSEVFHSSYLGFNKNQFTLSTK